MLKLHAPSQLSRTLVIAVATISTIGVAACSDSEEGGASAGAGGAAGSSSGGTAGTAANGGTGGTGGGTAGTGGGTAGTGGGTAGTGGGTAGTGGGTAGTGGGTAGTGGGTAGSAGSAGTGGTAGSAGSAGTGGTAGSAGSAGTGGTAGSAGSAGTGGTGGSDPGPPVGNPYSEATCAIPSGAGLENVSNPTTVVGNGTPASCTSDAFVDAVAQGGIITFNCGPAPITITLDQTAKVFNDTGPNIVIDGGGLVTLSGGGARRILYMNTCDPDQVWTTSHCQNQDHPTLTVQNITFVNANSKSETEYDGGGAIWVRGGRFKVVNARFFNNVCADVGPDVGGAGIRVFSQYNGLPVYVVNSTFGGAQGYGNTCSNGGGISSIGVSWTIINSFFSHNRAIGNGGNPAQSGTPGGGSGGAIYNDGNTMTLSLCGTRLEYNEVNSYGSAIFFVTNNHTGNIVIDNSNITNNIGGSWYPTYPQISNHSDTPIDVTNSVIQ